MINRLQPETIKSNGAVRLKADHIGGEGVTIYIKGNFDGATVKMYAIASGLKVRIPNIGDVDQAKVDSEAIAQGCFYAKGRMHEIEFEVNGGGANMNLRVVVI